MGVKLSEWKLKITDTGVAGMMGKITSLADKAAGRMGALQERADKFAQGVKNAASEVPGLNRVLQLVTNPYVAVTAGVVGLGAALVTSGSMALDWNKGLAQVNTTARLGKADLAGLSDRLLEMGGSGKSAVPLAQIPGAFNRVISAVGDTKAALDIFEPALLASQAGFTDIKTVVEATTNVMGSVGNATPTDVFNTLFAAVRVGKGEFAEFANYLPKIIPLANNVGIKYTEVAGAFAMMTGKGQTAEQTTMLLSNAMTALSKSEVIYGSKSKAGFERSGIAIFDHQGKMRKLTQIVDDLAARTNGLTDKQKQAFLAGLGLDAQAAAAFSVMAQNSGIMKEAIAATTNSAGEMQAAYDRSLNPLDRAMMLLNQMLVPVVRLGQQLLPLVNWALDRVADSIVFVKMHFNTLLAVAEGVGAGIGLILASMGASFIWTGVVGVTSLLSTVGATFLLQYALLAVRTAIFSIPIIGWAALVVAALVAAWNYSEKFRATIYGIGNVLMALWDPIKLLGAAIANLFNPAAFAANMAAFVQSVRNLDVGQSFSQGYASSMLESAKNEGLQKKTALSSLGNTSKAPAPGAPISKLKDGIKAVAEGGRSVRNVVVNIGALVKEIKVTSGINHSGKSDSELADFIKETLIRAVSGAEQALAS